MVLISFVGAATKKSLVAQRDNSKMHYARVGAMPQPETHTNPHTIGAGGNQGQQQGITMEDLKKQTALRLAQEQHRGGSSEMEQPGNERSNMHILPPDRGSLVYPQNFAVPYNSYPAAGDVPLSVEATGGSFQVVETSQQQFPGQSIVDNTNMNRDRKTYKPTVSASRSSPTGQAFGAVKSGTQRSPRSEQSGSSNARADSAAPNRRKGASSKSKLPHGLTVQELKEMTKARLQAEAAETGETVSQSPSNIPTLPYGRDSRERTSPVALIHDIPAFSNALNLTASPGMPSGYQGRVSPHHSVAHIQNVSRYEVSVHQGVGQSRDSSWQMLGANSGFDGWDNASVTSKGSTAGSDYLGSESAHSASVSGVYQQDEAPTSLTFSRSRSYGGYDHHSIERSPVPFATGSPFAEFPAGQNRHRASTSPRPVLINLHEDRPLGNSATESGLSSFESSGIIYPRVLTINSDGDNNEPMMSHSTSSSPARFLPPPQTGFAGGVFLSNRPRTASAPTVRPVPHPSEDFLGRGTDSLARLPSANSRGVGGLSTGDVPINGFETAFGTTSASALNQESEYFSSVFRQPSRAGTSHRPPPGLFPGIEPSGSGLLSASGSRSLEFGVDDIWGKPATDPRSREPAARLRAHTDGEALLAESLGSVLRLSGNRNESSQNGLVSRIDPELDFNRNPSVVSPIPHRTPVISPSQGSHDSVPLWDNASFERGPSRNENPRFQ